VNSHIAKKLSLLAIVLSVLAIFVSPTNAASNPQINYQGKLTNSLGATVADGTYNMRFWLLTTQSIATTSAVWTESLTSGNKVQVTNGLFSVMLGSTSALTSVNFSQRLYLGVEIGGTGAAVWDGEMSPRKILGTVPAAFEARRLGGVASTSFVRSDEADTIAASTASTLLTITQNGVGDILNLFDGATEVFSVLDGGRVGIGSSTPSQELSVAGDVSITGRIYDSSNNAGTNGMVLKATGTGFTWVATSTLGLGGSSFGASINVTELAAEDFGSFTCNGTTCTVDSNSLSATMIANGDHGIFSYSSNAASLDANGLTSANLLSALSDETGTGALVFGTAPTISSTTISGILKLSSQTASRALFTDAQSRATTTALSATLLNALTDETGTGVLVFGTAPTLSAPTFTGKTTLANATSTNLTISGRLYDNSNNAGTNGMVLKSTGTGFTWVATSTLGISGGSSLFTDGGSATYLTSLTDNFGLGTTTANAKLVVVGTAGSIQDIFKVASSTGATLLNVTSRGNVGIGTSSPTTLLYVGTTGSRSTTTFAALNGVSNGSAVEFIENSNRSGFALTHDTLLNYLRIGGGPSGAFTSHLNISRDTGNVGIGTTTPQAKLNIEAAAISAFTGTTDGNFRLQADTGANEYTAIDFSSRAAIVGGSSWGNPLARIAAQITSLGSYLHFGTSNLYSSGVTNDAMVINPTGDVGMGTSTPNKRLQIFETVADDQLRISYDTTRYADFQVDSVGDLIIDAQGDDVRLNDENLWVCSGGSCPAGSPSGNGNAIIESRLGVGTSSPREAVEIWNDLYVANGGATGMGQSTSTFQGDVLILGKLDVGTIDPIYKIGDVNYATYGLSSIGIKEEASQTVAVEELNEETGYYETKIAWSDMEKGSDLWLFYQVTDFGEMWKNLAVSLTPNFDGTVFYTKDLVNNALVIQSTSAGEVSVRFIANRFDWEKWSNLRKDQESKNVHFRLEEKE